MREAILKMREQTILFQMGQLYTIDGSIDMGL